MQIHIIYIVRLLYMYSNYDEKTCITFISYMYERKTREPYFEIVVHVALTLFNFFFSCFMLILLNDFNQCKTYKTIMSFNFI